jgi:anaerobic ribonucleoside-triphosphate reductase activating protein
MNFGGIIYDAVNIYDGVAVEIYISGCNHKCYGCHNPEMQNFDYGNPIELIPIKEFLYLSKEWFDIIAILGGDLMCQPEHEAKNFIVMLKSNFKDKKLWLFTGKEKEEISQWCFEYFDVIKTGKYIQELKQDGKLASSNQKLLYKGKDY